MIVHNRQENYYSNDRNLRHLLRKLLFILSFSIVVTGCDSLSTGQLVDSLVSTSTFPITVTPISSSTTTPILSDTVTPSPSLTPTPTFSPTPTIFYNGHEKLLFSTDLGLFQSDATGANTTELFSRNDLLNVLELENAFEHYLWPSLDGKKLIIEICIGYNDFYRRCNNYRYFLSQIDLTNMVELEFPDNRALRTVEWSPLSNRVLLNLSHVEENRPGHVDGSSYYVVDCDKGYGEIKFVFEGGGRTPYPIASWANTQEGQRIYAVQNYQFFMLSEDGIRLNNLYCPFCKDLRKYTSGVRAISIANDGDQVFLQLGGLLGYVVNLQTSEFSSFILDQEGFGPVLWKSNENAILINTQRTSSAGGSGTRYFADGIRVINLESGEQEYFVIGKDLINKSPSYLRVCSLFPDNVHYFSTISFYIGESTALINQIFVGNLSTGIAFRWQSLDTESEYCPVWISAQE